MLPRALLTLIAVCTITKASVVFEKEWSFTEDSLFSFDRSLAKFPDTFVYAYCNTSDFVQNNDCTFVLNNLDSSQKKVCHTKLYGSESRNFNFIFERFKGNEVLIVRLEVEDNEVTAKHSLLDMNSCNLVDSDDKFVKTDWMQTVTYRNSFDLIYTRANETRRIVRNRKDESSPFPEYLNIELVLPVSADGPQDGFFAVGHLFGSYVVVHVTESGDITNLFSHPLDHVNKCSYTPHSNDRFGVCCDLGPTEMRCTQLRREDSAWTNSSVDLERRRVLAMHNANDGGLLVLTSECAEELDLSNCRNSSMLRINIDNTQETLFVIPGSVFRCETYKDLTSVEVHESPSDGICVDFAYVCSAHVNEGYRSVLKLDRRCQ